MEAGLRMRTVLCRLPLCCALVGITLFHGSFARPACAYTPKSPEVQRLVKSALAFLDGKTHKELGGKCLIGLAFVKADYPHTDPNIVAAVNACKKASAGVASASPKLTDIYSLGIAVIFLCELDPDQYRKEITTLLGVLKDRQKEHGGWGYPNLPTGDTSMTQYGVLSAWTAKQAGINIDNDNIERVVGWLERTQDPGGGWAYQGNDPGHSRGIQQNSREITPSMTAAGAGSMLMCAHLLGAIHIKDQETLEGIPSALQLVDASQAATTSNESSDPPLDRPRIQQSVGRAGNWFQANYKIDWGPDTYYYLYALERYMSFRELVERKDAVRFNWYDDAVEYLARSQADNGSWKTQRVLEEIDTSFVVLFLLRSTRKSIRRALGYGDELNGGRTLPGDVANLRIEGNRIVKDPITLQVDQMLSILKNPDHPDFDKIKKHGHNLPLLQGDELDENQIAKLRQLIRGGEPEVRRLAVRALARTQDLDHVPVLIYGLTDPDWPVVRESRDGLRFVSRKFRGYGIPDRKDNEKRLVAINRWKQWYLTIRPEALFEN